MKKKPTLIHPGKLRSIVAVAARMIKNDPTLLDDIDDPVHDDRLKRLRGMLKREIPDLADQKHCANCGASMAEYELVLDINDALLMFKLAKVVRENQGKGIPFTEANKVRVSNRPDIGHTQKCRTTKCSKLGLLAKVKKLKAHWSITSRGWDGLRGEPVPESRVTFRGQILERPEKTTTFREVFYQHGRKIEELAKLRKLGKRGSPVDHRHEYADYDPEDWVHIAGMHQGNLI